MLLARRCKMRFVKAMTDPRVTFAELQTWPDDGRRYELYDGEAIVVPSPFPRHQRVVKHLGDVLGEYEDTHGGVLFNAPIDIIFDEHNVLQPDLVYFREQRRHVVHDWEVTRAAPDLAVEVLSRSTEARDRGRKMQILARFGVAEYWLVDPAKNTVEIYVLNGQAFEFAAAIDDAGAVKSPTVPGLSFDTASIFAP